MKTGSIGDVVAELRLQCLQAEAHGERSIIVRGTAHGDLLLWTRADGAHFTDALSYPRPEVPVVDVDLWAEARPSPRVLLVASTAVQTILVCPVRSTARRWVKKMTDGERGYRPAWACPRDLLQPLGWLKRHLIGGAC